MEVLWSPSYYVGTARYVSAEVIEKYIEPEQTKWSGSGTIHLLVKRSIPAGYIIKKLLRLDQFFVSINDISDIL